MFAHKSRDAVLNLPEIVKSLLYADHHTRKPYRMDHHRSRWHDIRIIRADRDRHADGVASAKHKRDRRLAYGSDHLRDGQSRLHITTHRIEQNQHPVYIPAVLDCRQLRQYMLVFGRLGRTAQIVMPFDFPDDRDQMYFVMLVVLVQCDLTVRFDPFVPVLLLVLLLFLILPLLFLFGILVLFILFVAHPIPPKTKIREPHSFRDSLIVCVIFSIIIHFLIH